jgi:dipeptidyl aminopeptidase/acylaminoacyl peptidase
MNKWTTFVALAVVSLAALVSPPHAAAQQDPANPPIMRPVISEEVAPLQTIAPVAQDGHRGEGFLRKPPGDGPFPAIVLIHGGLSRLPTERIREYALNTHPSRFLEAGYVIAAITYRSRDIDPITQTTLTVQDAVAAVDYLKGLPYVDSNSVVINGCSGGGDIALEVAAATEVAAIVPEEPAAMHMAGVVTADLAALGVGAELDYVQLYRVNTDHQRFAEKIARISSPVLIVQGDSPGPGLNRFNAEVLIPELRAAGTSLEVMTYPGEPHCFAFYSRTRRPAVALKAFQDIDSFIRRYVETQPQPIPPSLVQHVPVESR